MNETHLTEDELVALLTHSSLTTILVEGKTDMSIYRWIEDDLEIEADILVCGCRDTLFKVYNRRREFNHIKTIFVADSDKYVYSSIPVEYKDIIFTKGYSIENDLYQGCQIETLLTKKEDEHFRVALENFIKYYSCQIEKLSVEVDVNLAQNPHQILDVNNSYALRKDQVHGGYHNPSTETLMRIQANYDLLLRGHSLIALLLIFLSDSKRRNKYSAQSICECCYKLKRSDAIIELLNKLNLQLSLTNI